MYRRTHQTVVRGGIMITEINILMNDQMIFITGINPIT